MKLWIILKPKNWTPNFTEDLVTQKMFINRLNYQNLGFKLINTGSDHINKLNSTELGPGNSKFITLISTQPPVRKLVEGLSGEQDDLFHQGYGDRGKFFGTEELDISSRHGGLIKELGKEKIPEKNIYNGAILQLLDGAIKNCPDMVPEEDKNKFLKTIEQLNQKK